MVQLPAAAQHRENKDSCRSFWHNQCTWRLQPWVIIKETNSLVMPRQYAVSVGKLMNIASVLHLMA